jgi:hypothetical protein
MPGTKNCCGTRDRGQVLGQALDPLDVHDSFFLGCATALREHAGVRIQTDRPREQISDMSQTAGAVSSRG